MNKDIINDVCIMIPAYEPEESFVEFSKDVVNAGYKALVIDDGSGEKCKDLFARVEALGVKVLVHEVNKGKGQALRTGFADIRDNWPEVKYIVTADCDGQHSLKDIGRVLDTMRENPSNIVIGERFTEADRKVPFRSRLGNGLARALFKIASGLKINDTQTGLRGIPAEMIPEMLETKGDRYEYEMNMLLNIKTWGVGYTCIPIETIYINNNAGSHYNVWRDTARVFMQIIKFCAASLFCFFLEYLLFCLFEYVVFNKVPVVIAIGIVSFSLPYILSRLISSVANYLINRRLVFKKGSKSSIPKYIALVVVMMLLGAFLTKLLAGVGIPAWLCKIIVDLPLSVSNYFVQREWVFKKKK